MKMERNIAKRSREGKLMLFNEPQGMDSAC
jgi:hypothetical protein